MWIRSLKTTTIIGAGQYSESIASKSSLTVLLAKFALNQVGDKQVSPATWEL